MFAIIFILLICCSIGYTVLRMYQKWFVKKKPPIDNPYIKAHKLRQANDRWYDDYINWMNKSGAGLPIDKVKTPEEIRFEKEMKETYKK